MSLLRSKTTAAILFAVIAVISMPAIQAIAAESPRYYIQSSPLPRPEYVRDIAKALSPRQFEIFGDQLGSLTDLPKTKAALELWAKKVPDGVVIIWNPNRIEQQFGFSSLMRTIESLGKVAVIMVGFHSPSPAVKKVSPIYKTYATDCNLMLNWTDLNRNTER